MKRNTSYTQSCRWKRHGPILAPHPFNIGTTTGPMAGYPAASFKIKIANERRVNVENLAQ